MNTNVLFFQLQVYRFRWNESKRTGFLSCKLQDYDRQWSSS